MDRLHTSGAHVQYGTSVTAKDGRGALIDLNGITVTFHTHAY